MLSDPNTCRFIINTQYFCRLFLCVSEPTLIEDDEDKEEPAPLSVPKPAAVPVAQSAIDLTAEFLHPLLNPENVANLVRTSGLFAVCFSPLSLTVQQFSLYLCLAF